MGLIDYVKFFAFGTLDLLEALVAHIKVLALEAYLHHLCLTFKNYKFSITYFKVYLSLEANNED